MKNLSIILMLIFLGGCHYAPFLKYKTKGGEDGFPKFKSSDYLRGTENDLRTAYDITMYDWTVVPDAGKKSLKGKIVIGFKAVLPADTVLLDLQNRMKISSISLNGSEIDYSHKGDILFAIFKEPLKVGKNYSLTIEYKGKPAILLGQGPILWNEDERGNPFVSTITQGIGPHFLMPCKDLLYDEPDSCHIRVGVKEENLIAVANGQLRTVYQEDGVKYYHYAVSNPINIYNISFNIGDYVGLEFPYRSINGNDYNIEAFVLAQDSAKGANFYAQTPRIMEVLEGLFGEFPWWEDGCKFLQSGIKYGAMEHQSAISMGDIFYNDWKIDTAIHSNSTLAHELAHEWWGNSVTARDYGDAWLHEGMATYCEALVAEKLYGKKAYEIAVIHNMKRVDNERSLIKPFGVRYNSWVSSKDADIYNKGALFMHTLRMQINNDDLFFSAYRDAYEKFKLSAISTAMLEEHFNQATGKNLSPFFEVYLKQAEAPTLLYFMDGESNRFSFRWKNPLPENFNMRVIIGENPDTLHVYPRNTYQTVELKSRTLEREKFGYLILEKEKNPPTNPAD